VTGALGIGALALLVGAGSSGAAAQEVRATAFGAAVTNAEVEDTRQARGLGGGIGAEVTFRRFRAEVSYLHAALEADYSIQPDYNLDQLDLSLSWFWRPYLAAQIGAARRFTSPEFVAQEVGLFRIGVLSETRLARIAGIWARGAYLPLTRYSGGGSAGLGLELGLGVDLGSPEGRFAGFAAFAYQRLDRNAAAEAPLQFSVGQAGVRVRLR
jgi:hypothetical protein